MWVTVDYVFGVLFHYEILVLDDNYFNNIYQHPRPKTLAEAGYVVDDYLCLPYDIHVQPVSKDRAEPQIEDGQFDDDSEEDGTWWSDRVEKWWMTTQGKMTCGG